MVHLLSFVFLLFEDFSEANNSNPSIRYQILVGFFFFGSLVCFVSSSFFPLITSCYCCASFLLLYVFITVRIRQVFRQRLRQRDTVHVDKNFIEDDLSAVFPLEGVDLTCVRRRLSDMSNIHYCTGGPVHRRLAIAAVS